MLLRAMATRSLIMPQTKIKHGRQQFRLQAATSEYRGQTSIYHRDEIEAAGSVPQSAASPAQPSVGWPQMPDGSLQHRFLRWELGSP
jgi:hypothetical protein